MQQSQIKSENEDNIPYFCQENLHTKTNVFASKTIFFMGDTVLIHLHSGIKSICNLSYPT
jgi:hypothetical protein